MLNSIILNLIFFTDKYNLADDQQHDDDCPDNETEVAQDCHHKRWQEFVGQQFSVANRDHARRCLPGPIMGKHFACPLRIP